MPPKDGSVARTVSLLRRIPAAAWNNYRAMSATGKLSLWSLLFFYVALGTFIIVVSPSRIAQTLYDWAQDIAKLQFGWLVFCGVITLVSFPPAIGHTTTLILCGFAYGMKGWFIAAGASVFGATLSFTLLRLVFRKKLRELSSKNHKWQALEAVIRAKGLPLICLIRMSPLPPWVYSNALFASIEPVKLWQFILANAFVMPKITLSVFIGARAAGLADGDQREKMDRTTKLLNVFLICLSLSASIIASWVIYRQMQKHLRNLDDIPPEEDRLAVEALEDAEEGAPLLRSLSSDSLHSEPTLRRHVSP